MKELAQKLYSLCEGMDAGDYEETKEKDIQAILADLEALPKNSTLLLCLEYITENFE